MDSFRLYIQKRQRELGLSENQLAKRAGFKSSSGLNRFMNQETKDLKMSTFLRIAKALETPAEQLVLAYQGKDVGFDAEIKEDFYRCFMSALGRYFSPEELKEKARQVREKYGD